MIHQKNDRLGQVSIMYLWENYKNLLKPVVRIENNLAEMVTRWPATK